jgi:chromosomal replication initiator protein
LNEIFEVVGTKLNHSDIITNRLMNVIKSQEKAVGKDCHVVWDNCLKTIREAVGEQSFKTWFEPVKPVRILRNVLTIQVPSQFFYEWLEEHYVPVLRKAVVQELGSDACLEYSIVVDKGTEQQRPFTINIPNNPKVGTLNTNHAKPMPASQVPATPSLNPFALKCTPQDNFLTNLNTQYTFDNLVEGECNRMAYHAGVTIAHNPGHSSFNPMLIYGGVGLGKTHLAQAIGNGIRYFNPGKLVLYTSSDLFTTQFVEALRKNQIQEFTNYYLQVDALIIDDIQFLAGKEKTQDQFFHIFNYLHQAGKQIVLTSDCAPSSLLGLQERLLSRFKWGVVADVYIPDYQTRVNIIKAKVQSQGISISPEVIDFLAQKITTNIRELQGVLISLIAHASLLRCEMDMALARRIMDNIVKAVDDTENVLTIEEVIRVVAEHFHLNPEQLKAATRKQEIAHPRQIAMYICQRHTAHSLKVIGKAFGGRDHSTVSHASKTVEEKMSQDSIYKSLIDAIRAKLNIRKK